jgi:transposase
LVQHLFQEDVLVSIVNPSTVRAFAKGEGIKALTDPIDAQMLLKYGQTRELKPSPRTDPAREELAALMDRRSHLPDSLTCEKNRLDKDPGFTRKLIEKSVRFLEKQIEEVDGQIVGILRPIHPYSIWLIE